MDFLDFQTIFKIYLYYCSFVKLQPFNAWDVTNEILHSLF